MSDLASLIEKATSALLLDIDWDTTLQIVDMIRQGDVSAQNAVNALLPKIHDSNPNVVILALQVLESIVKNCGQAVQEHIATWEFMVEIRDLLKKSSNDDVQKKILLLLATWVYAFRSELKYRAVQDTVNLLKAEGYKIPTVIESDAMFTADCAPDWADGECCHRCRSQFTMLRRKHHCRACGQVFCSDCSSKTSTIPKFGIERDVRVCEHCYDEINSAPRTSAGPKQESVSKVDGEKNKTSSTTPDKKSAEELREEEELQLALALSKSEAENKEKEKLKATCDILGSGWRPTRQTSSPSSIFASPKTGVGSTPVEKEETDPELAKYLNRSFWEQREKQRSKEVNVEGSGRTQSPVLPSAPFSTIKANQVIKVDNYFQNGGVEEVDDFVSTLRGQLEIFVNRMKSNQSRGRPIANDTAVQSLFMNITAMHSQLLTYIQDQDRKRVHGEQLQDKISQIRDARAALDALREEHGDKLRREKEEQERLRQIQMMQKLEIMRKKKQEYLEYQRQLALHRMAESERQILSAQQHNPSMPQPGPPPQTGFPPMVYPQGYPQGQVGGYMYPGGNGENVPSAAGQTIVPPYQGPQGNSMPGGQPPIPNFPTPPNPDYGRYTLPGGPTSMNNTSAGYGTVVTSGMGPQSEPTVISSVQVAPQQPISTPGPQPSFQPQTQKEEAPLISFD